MKTELQHIHKSFGKVHANDDVSLVIESGEILGILGRKWRWQDNPDEDSGRAVACRCW
jgi:ABC-type histidine transport system ATPase subunit